MDGPLMVLLYAFLPTLGVVLGVALAECVPASRTVVGAALHAAGGIAIALICFEMTPRIMDVLPMWQIVIGFLAGAALSILAARGVSKVQKHISTSGGALMVFVVISADLVSDGLMVGAGSAVTGTLGLLLAASQTVANMPGGFAAGANLTRDGAGRRKRYGMAAALIVPAVLAAGLGYWVLTPFGDGVRLFALAAVAGLLLTATVEDMIPEGDQREPSRKYSTPAFALGFAGMGLLTAYAG